MKVVIISATFLPSHDGVSITLYERIKQLSIAGHEALCLVSSYQEIAAIYPKWSDYVGDLFPNVKIISLNSEEWMDVPQERNPKRSTLKKIEGAIAEFEPDIIEIEEPERLWTTLFSLPGLQYAQQNEIPYIGCYRTNFIDYIPDYVPSLLVGIAKTAALFLTKWIYNQCSITLVGSRFIEKKLQAWGIKNVDYAKVIGPPVIKNPLSLKEAGFFEKNFNLAKVDDTVKVLFLGRLSPDKNWDFTLQHLAKLKQKNISQKFTILVAGRGELDEAIAASEFATELPTEILGEVPHEQIPKLLANVDFHVTASLKETFGRTVQESLYVGTPILAPDCDWTRNLVEPAQNGILFDPESGDDFIQKLADLIENNGDRQRLRENILANHSEKNDPSYIWIEYLQRQINQAQTQ
ncbi:glycosyltransferase [[Limnothrix rosea] IAM M-220]|uniref:glycosyltransferase n=1 Tax=[Limnothrix rosea] IAM M-220 TaxID=454133 RepID=UPI0009689E6B|nr:glycosyltransferase [[Limnothrix rosea] IAM M-220]OKH18912.1 glycoside hydrolase [[Limnothrix rosea] IAM M-220]